MKIRYLVTIFLAMVLVVSNVNASSGNVIDYKNKKSKKVFLCEEKYYGYHQINEDYHFHEVTWNNEKKEWIINDSKKTLKNQPCALKNKEKVLVKFSDCVDGDTAKFILNDEKITVRFLAVDTPETKHPNKKVEVYGKEASSYTCNTLKTAKNIYLEYDEFNKLDKYNRHLAWVFADDELIQETLVKIGYAQVAYLYDNYKYVSNLQILQEVAQEKKIGIWELNPDQLVIEDDDTGSSTKEFKEKSTDEKVEYIIYIILVIVIVSTNVIKIIKKKK